MVLAGKAVEQKRFGFSILRTFGCPLMENPRLGEIELSPFQESILSRGLRVMHDVKDKMCDTVNVAIGYSAVLGAELFSEVEMTNDCLQRLDQNQVSYSKKVCFH